MAHNGSQLLLIFVILCYLDIRYSISILVFIFNIRDDSFQFDKTYI